MDLQNTFYVIGIIYMGLATLILIGIVVAVFAIKAKINAIQKNIEEKIRTVTDIAHVGEMLFDKAKDMAGHHHER